jgi:O-antigen chain-terminating methyltransferase
MDKQKKSALIEQRLKANLPKSKESSKEKHDKLDNLIENTAKEKIKNIPFLLKPARWLYRLFKLPTRFHNLSQDFNMHNRYIASLQEAVELLQKNTISINEKIDAEFKIVAESLDNTQNSIDTLLKKIDRIENGFDIEQTYTMSYTVDKTVVYDYKKTTNDLFYNFSQEILRGSKSEIEKRQLIYLDIVKQAIQKTNGSYFLDIGCGRGEFLDILKQNNISAKGIDIDAFNISLLSNMGFNVEVSDAIKYLEKLENNTLTGISMFQVIEHLGFNYAKKLLELAYNKISPGGVIIIETPNPHCFLALANFYSDTTHIKPYPAMLLASLVQWSGFDKIEIILSSPIPKHLRTKEPLINYQDYAICATKTLEENT